MTSQCSVYICDFGLARTKPEIVALEDEQATVPRASLQAEAEAQRFEIESTRLDHEMDDCSAVEEEEQQFETEVTSNYKPTSSDSHLHNKN